MRLILALILGMSAMAAKGQGPKPSYVTQSYLRTVNLDSLRVLDQKYIGFSANPMLSALLPLNRLDPRTDLVSLKYRKFKGFKGISYTFGMATDDVNDQLDFVGAHIIFERRRPLSNNLWYYQGQGIGFEFFTNPQQSFFFQEDAFFLVMVNMGIEYRMNDVFSLSTEAAIRAGAGSIGIAEIRAPVNIIAHFNITR
ncbi:MAG: hypothetical protein ACO3DK_05450 [Bacteroidia bacterium]